MVPGRLPGEQMAWQLGLGEERYLGLPRWQTDHLSRSYLGDIRRGWRPRVGSLSDKNMSSLIRLVTRMASTTAEQITKQVCCVPRTDRWFLPPQLDGFSPWRPPPTDEHSHHNQ